MIYQEFDSRKINHFLSGFIGLLIVSCEPPESVKPCESSFHDPSQRLGSKTFDPVWCIADLKLYHKIGLYLIRNISAITSVHENFLKCRPKESCLLAQRIGQFGIMLSGIVNCPSEDEAVAVNHDVAFDTLYLFIGIETVIALAVAHLTLCASNAPTVGLSFCPRLRLILMTVFSMKCSIWPSSLHLRKNL